MTNDSKQPFIIATNFYIIIYFQQVKYMLAMANLLHGYPWRPNIVEILTGRQQRPSVLEENKRLNKGVDAFIAIIKMNGI